MNTNICRIAKIELLNGTYYIPQRWVLKTRWFREAEYVWEDFILVTNYYGLSYFKKLRYDPYYVLPPTELRKIETAERICGEYVRVNAPDSVVKVWTKDELRPTS